jgi:hypothetical protein
VGDTVGEQACRFADVTAEELDEQHRPGEIDVATDLVDDAIGIPGDAGFPTGKRSRDYRIWARRRVVGNLEPAFKTIPRDGISVARTPMCKNMPRRPPARRRPVSVSLDIAVPEFS